MFSTEDGSIWITSNDQLRVSSGGENVCNVVGLMKSLHLVVRKKNKTLSRRAQGENLDTEDGVAGVQ